MAAGVPSTFNLGFPAGPSGSGAIDRRQRDMVELCFGYALILLVLWTPNPWQRILYCGAVVFFFAVSWASFESWAAFGMRAANGVRSLWIVGVALALGAAAIVVAIRLHTLHQVLTPSELLKRFWGYALFALAQQFLLQDFFLPRFLRLLQDRKTPAVLLATGVFSVAHLPNPILTLVTFAWGLAACLLFLHYRNLYSLAVTHAVFGICVAITLPGPMVHNMRVGLGYLTYKPHHGHHRNHSDHTVSTVACVIAEAPILCS